MKSVLRFALTFSLFVLFTSHVSARNESGPCFPGKAIPFVLGAKAAGDLDGDGDVDIVVTSINTTTQFKVALNDGRGNFTDAGSYGNSSGATQHVVLFDIDGDTDRDVIVTNEQAQSGSLEIFTNNGDASFGSGTSLTGFPKIEFVSYADLDGDSDTDLVLISQEEVIVLGNSGGAFTVTDSHVYNGTAFEQVVVADLDGDGQPDIAVSERLSGAVWVYSNSGSLAFSESVSLSVGSSVGGLASSDIDGDQDSDLIAETAGNNLVVIKNNGNQTFSIGDPFPRQAAYDALLQVEDYDNDGDLDIFDGISWHVNENGEYLTRVDVVTDRITTGILADVDHDGDSDVVFSPFNTNGTYALSVTRSNGDGTYEGIRRHAIDIRSSSMLTVDLDLDSLPDVVNLDRSGGEIGYQLNLGNKTFGNTVIIDIPFPQAVTTGDVDDDGDVDIVVASGGSVDTVSILLQDEAGQFTVSSSLPAGDNPRSLSLADFDADGDLDLVVGTELASAMVGICVNDAGTFGSLQSIEAVSGGLAQNLVVADFDNDNDLDFVLSSRTNNELNYNIFMNDGNANFSSMSVENTGNSISGKLYAADINGDSNQDLVQARTSGGAFHIMFGNGDGTFGTSTTVGTHNLTRGTDIVDVDGDQDLDFVARLQGAVLIYENVNGVIGDPLWFGMSGDGELSCRDFDGDGAIDLLGQDQFVFYVSYQCNTGLDTVAFGPTTASIEQGTLRFGSVDDLIQSDNIDLSIARNRAAIHPRVEIVVNGTSPIANPSSIELTLESSVFARSNVEQTIELFNFVTGVWDSIDVRNASRFGDATTTVIVDSNAGDYIEPGGAVEARIRHNSKVARLAYSVNIDLIQWVINR